MDYFVGLRSRSLGDRCSDRPSIAGVLRNINGGLSAPYNNDGCPTAKPGSPDHKQQKEETP